MRAYLDHNATSPLRPEARAALEAALAGGNASSPHREGQAARATLEAARGEVAALVGARPREVVFTATGTEALNLALRGHLVATAFARPELVVSAIEHEAVLAAADAIAGEGVRIQRVPVGRDGRIALDALARAVSEQTALVALMLANNETGVLQPVAEAAAIAHRAGALLVVDAVQAAGRIAVDRTALGADFLALSAHKLGGALGAGALVVRSGVPLASLSHGGGQEGGRRSGTENVPAIAAFAAAARVARERLAPEAERLAGLRAELERELLRRFPGASINGLTAPRLPNTCSVTLPGIDAEALVVRLDLEGVAASTGSACAAGAAEPSHVLAAMALAPDVARATLRFSLGWSSVATDLECALAALGRAVDAQRAAGASAGPRP